MTDPHPLLRALQGPPPPEAPPAWPAMAPRRGHIPLLALAALLLAAPIAVWRLRGPAADDWTLRGPAAAPAVDLRLAVQRGAALERARADRRYRVGDRVFFRVGAATPVEVEVWAERSGRREPLARVQAGPTPVDLRSDGGLIAYDLGEPGRFSFCAAPAGAAPTCIDLEAE